ncbi:hypothetical protein NPIL_106261 [Nephila pilipes]|uniref:Uncharacterized protein n=1 Tax=Nephila pilipes TaxID=299642 RepID=A0A8X6PAR0_NEPPI|nr:hypothetical protein NPIL_106261 [Nephila pilipes]
MSTLRDSYGVSSPFLSHPNRQSFPKGIQRRQAPEDRYLLINSSAVRTHSSSRRNLSTPSPFSFARHLLCKFGIMGHRKTSSVSVIGWKKGDSTTFNLSLSL